MFGYVNTEDIFKIDVLYTAFSERHEKSYYFGGEYHNFWEIVIVTEGELGITAGGDVFMLKKGQAVIHEPMEFHRLWNEGKVKTEYIIFSFKAKGVPKFSSNIFEIKDLAIPGEILNHIQENFKIHNNNVIEIQDPDSINYQIAIKELEMFILNTLSQKIEKSGKVKSQPAKNYTRIVNIMESNIDKNLSVWDIAKLCNMSEVNLKKTFSRYSGMGVMAYFNHLKVTAAIERLKRGETVQETANALGFSNQNYFSTVFKRITGKNPTYYKQ